MTDHSRDQRPWCYVLRGESVFREWKERRGGMAEMLGFAREPAVTTVKAQGVLL